MDGPGATLTAQMMVGLYDSHARQLYHYLARRIGGEIAEDLVAETFVTAWEQRDGFDPSRGSARSWLYGVATNLARRHVRTEVRRLRAWARAHTETHMEDVGTRVAETVDATVLAGQVADELAALRAEEREVLLLVAWADLTPTEIAGVLGIPVATVRTRLHRARTRMRRAALVPFPGPTVSRTAASTGEEDENDD